MRLAFWLCLAPAAVAVLSAQEASPNELFVTAGKTVLVNTTAPIERVSVGFGNVAEATAVSPREVLVNGKAPGETSLIIWERGGEKLFFSVVVRASRLVANDRVDSLRRELKKELGGQNVAVSMEGDYVFLRGTVKDLTSAERAMAIAASFGKPVNLLYVDVPAQDSQILLKVRFASVDRTVESDLGMNLISTGATNTIGSVTTQQNSPPSYNAQQNLFSFSDLLNIFLFRRDLNLGATIKALERKAMLEVLAEPNVLAINGKEASFLAGGEFPYPVVQGGGAGTVPTVTVQFREFGVRINFIPTMTPRGTIRLQVAPEVSALDFVNGLVYQGFTIPALTVRKVNTAIELEPGQSFAIGGLMDNRLTQTIEKIPLLGDVPLLGKLFRSKALQKENTELLVFVTPELVRPLPEGQPAPSLNYPAPFLKPNSDIPMSTPASKTGPVPVHPPSTAIPYESLMQSLQPDRQMTLSPSKTGGSTASPLQSDKPATPPPAAPVQPVQ